MRLLLTEMQKRTESFKFMTLMYLTIVNVMPRVLQSNNLLWISVKMAEECCL